MGKIRSKGVEKAVWIIISVAVAAVVVVILAASIYNVFHTYSSTSSEKQTNIFSFLHSILPHLSSFPIFIFLLSIPALAFLILHSLLFPYQHKPKKGSMSLQKIMNLLLAMIIVTILVVVLLWTFKSLKKQGNVVDPKQIEYQASCNVKCRSIVNENPEVLTTQECVEVCIKNKGEINANMLLTNKDKDKNNKNKNTNQKTA